MTLLWPANSVELASVTYPTPDILLKLHHALKRRTLPPPPNLPYHLTPLSGKAWSTARGDMRERSKAETARLEMEKQREKIMKAAAEARAAAPEAFQTQQRRLSMAM